MKKIVVLTGAGMSAESGISTFRDTGGLWENHRVEDVATPEGFHKNPELVLEFYNQRRRELLKVIPNKGHVGLASLENDFKVSVVTQNVDNLHEQAGSTKVIHLHGELMKSCPVNNLSVSYDIPPEKPDILLGDTDANGVQLRPFIVWFGEAVPKIEEAVVEVESADILVIIGTSLNVYPAAGLLHYAKQGMPIFLIDPNEVRTHRNDIHFIQQPASKGVEELSRLLDKHK